MSPISTNTRRQSARIQEKDTSISHAARHEAQAAPAPAPVSQAVRSAKKRKNEYEEVDDDFAFTRVKKTRNKPQTKENIPTAVVRPSQNGPKSNPKSPAAGRVAASQTADGQPPPKKRRHKMSFSTPTSKDITARRRSKRISDEPATRDKSPTTSVEPKIIRNKRTANGEHKPQKETQQDQQQPSQPAKSHTSPTKTTTIAPTDEHAATKIALPMSDTPVIRRNKAMREGRGSRGERRSSLGLRGRRASSLIDAGNSNALPHQEVHVDEFYKHIESEQLEPRRMRQLLTWCATRAMHPKPQGSDFEDVHKIMSARAIEEELLKELASKSELSDWFSREDEPAPVIELPVRPNPKNIQNTDKIAELEQRIERLRGEKEALESLLRPPAIIDVQPRSKQLDSAIADIDRGLLSADDCAALDFLNAHKDHSTDLTEQINGIVSTLGPAVDAFADRVHKMSQYRNTADNIASRILSICADRLAERDLQGRKKALHTDEDRKPTQDMTSVLRGLSRIER